MNDQPIETQGWRDQSPRVTLKGDVIERALSVQTRRRFSPFAAGLVGSGIGVTALVMVTLMSVSQVSLAQVMAADAKADSITVVNKRIMGEDKGNGFTITTKTTKDIRSSSVTRYGASSPESWGYSDQKEVIWYQAGLNLAVYDQPSRKSSTPRLTASQILKDFKAAKVEKNFDWKGRKVTRFTYKAKLRSTDVDEELLVDPKTNLPIQFISMRDNGSWGDEWHYDYSKLDVKNLKPKIPTGTEIFDNRKQRVTMQNILAKATSQVPLVQVAPFQVGILVAKDLVRDKGETKFEVNLKTKSGETKVFSGSTSRFGLSTVQAKGRQYLVLVATNQEDSSWKDKSFGDKVSGSININGKLFSFTDLPAMRIADPYMLNGKPPK